MEFTFRRDPHNPKQYLRKKKTFELKPGLTVLVGCNGAGKSTLLHELKSYAREHRIPCFDFDNLTDDHHNLRFMGNTMEDINFIGTMLSSSEGEKTVVRMGEAAAAIGRMCLRDHVDAENIFILMDAIGSGTSIDNIVEIKEQLFDTILEHKTPWQNIYIVVATNEYEMCRNADCFDVQACEYRQFKSYNAYRSFILRSRKKRDKIG